MPEPAEAVDKKENIPADILITKEEAQEYLKIAKNGYMKALTNGNLDGARGYRTEMLDWNNFLKGWGLHDAT